MAAGTSNMSEMARIGAIHCYRDQQHKAQLASAAYAEAAYAAEAAAEQLATLHSTQAGEEERAAAMLDAHKKAAVAGDAAVVAGGATEVAFPFTSAAAIAIGGMRLQTWKCSLEAMGVLIDAATPEGMSAADEPAKEAADTADKTADSTSSTSESADAEAPDRTAEPDGELAKEAVEPTEEPAEDADGTADRADEPDGELTNEAAEAAEEPAEDADGTADQADESDGELADEAAEAADERSEHGEEPTDQADETAEAADETADQADQPDGELANEAAEAAEEPAEDADGTADRADEPDGKLANEAAEATDETAQLQPQITKLVGRSVAWKERQKALKAEAWQIYEEWREWWGLEEEAIAHCGNFYGQSFFHTLRLSLVHGIVRHTKADQPDGELANEAAEAAEEPAEASDGTADRADEPAEASDGEFANDLLVVPWRMPGGPSSSSAGPADQAARGIYEPRGAWRERWEQEEAAAWLPLPPSPPQEQLALCDSPAPMQALVPQPPACGPPPAHMLPMKNMPASRKRKRHADEPRES